MRFLIAAILALFVVLPAAAQNQLQSNSGALIKTMSPAELVAMLQANNLNASYLEEGNGGHFVEVNEDGAVVYFALRDCVQGSAITSRCGIIQPFGYYNASGVTFAQINAFNFEQSIIGTAGLTTDGTGIVGAKVYLQAGVSIEHVPFSIGLFFVDLDTLIAAINPGTLASLNYDDEGIRYSKVASLSRGLAIEEFQRANGAEWKVNAVGVNAPAFLNDAFRAYLAQR